MALQAHTSANGFTTGTLPGPFVTTFGTVTIGVGAGPFGINTVSFASAGGASIPNVSLAHANGVCVGFGVNIANSGNVGGVFYMGSGGNALEGSVGADGSIKLTMAFGNTITSASGVVSFGARHYCEWYIPVISNGQTAYIYVDGVLVASGAMTNLSGLPDPITFCYWGDPGGNLASATFASDSYYVLDTTTTINNSPLTVAAGATSITCGLGTALAHTSGSGWTTGGSAASLVAGISNIPPNGDTSYDVDGTAGDTMVFSTQFSQSWGHVFGISVVTTARQEVGAGGRSVASGLLGTYGTTQSLTTSYATQIDEFNKNPSTTVAWAVADLATLTMDLKVAT